MNLPRSHLLSYLYRQHQHLRLFLRLQHQHHRAEERNELPGRQVSLDRLSRSEKDDQRDAEAEDHLGHGHAQRAHPDQLEVLSPVMAVDRVEPAALKQRVGNESQEKA